jgi:glycosyltransferase involved in cell wall biosynthesis
MTGVLIGIPTHRRAILLRKCLESLAAQEGIPPSIRVFVADNDASNHEGVDIAEAMAGDFPFPLTASVVAEQGISAVRNAILDEARRCQAEFIAMIDDDETASPHWLAQLLKAQKAYGTDVVAGPV